jgi:hypothetical protein
MPLLVKLKLEVNNIAAELETALEIIEILNVELGIVDTTPDANINVT